MTRPPAIAWRGVLSLAGLALLAGLSYALWRWMEAELRPPGPVASQEPILIVERFRAVRLNVAGRRESVIEAPRLAQLPDKQGTRIEQPTLDWYLPDGQTRNWRLQAERGYVAADQQSVQLEGEVTIVRTVESGQAPLTIITRDVRVRPAERYAETSAPTRAVTPNGEFRAVGVRAFLDQERLELLSEVRGTHEPPKP